MAVAGLTTSTAVRVAVCSYPGSHDLAENLRRHLDYLDEAADAGADLVVFPEVSLHGYPRGGGGLDPRHLAAVYAAAEPVPDGPSVVRIAERARERGLHVVYGLHEHSGSAGVVYNTVVLTGPDGFIGRYRKVHMGVVEHVTWARGDDWPVFDTPLGRIGLMICYDKMWPEAARELVLRGAQILVTSSAWGAGPPVESWDRSAWVEYFRLFDRVRAAENARWVVSANYAGSFGESTFPGDSAILDPMGRVVAATPTGEVGLAVADIEVRAGIEAAYANTSGARLQRDRRDETYRALRGELAREHEL
ncbi:MAG: carbon-nitrogen hydrolase family protein [Nocardioidaceae bacterium]|nr:carbon-nitrogen hydrolase family protein [Nocardioidaceae bacterium]